MLKKHKLLIDKNCPMCKAYGHCFIKMGLIDEDTLTPYQNIDSSYTKVIDMERAKNEIAFHDTETGRTRYGLDAMVEIVSHHHPFLHRVLYSKWVYNGLLRLYRFISYNRKVIYPSAVCSNERDCAPEFNTKYRYLYLLFVTVMIGLVLNLFLSYVSNGLDIPYTWQVAFLLAFAQLGGHWFSSPFSEKEMRLEYLGNVSTVCLLGCLLMLPVLILHQWFLFSPIGLISAFGLITVLLCFEYFRRCKIMGVA